MHEKQKNSAITDNMNAASYAEVAVCGKRELYDLFVLPRHPEESKSGGIQQTLPVILPSKAKIMISFICAMQKALESVYSV
jgi:hypothetical protein